MESNLKSYSGKEFIYRSKYGSIVKGIIERVSPDYTINEKTFKLELKDLHIISTQGVVYNLNEIEIK